MSESCGQCRFFLADGGLCRRYPPSVVIVEQTSQPDPRRGLMVIEGIKMQAHFAIMSPENGWCGEFAARLDS